MKVYNNITNETPPETAVALGFFDGLHLGHKKVIKKTIYFKNKGLIPAVFTFSQNPKSVLSDSDIMQITNLDEKERYLEKMGVELFYAVDFLKIKDLSPEEFVKEILFKKLNAKVAVCGFNYHFGRGAAAGAEDLKKICKKYGIKTYIIKPVLYKKEIISSTKIRNALINNDLQTANDMLGIKNDKN